VVRLFRDVMEIVAPDGILLTETNVPHAENISYFGEGDEAHMVYNFSLPPLLLHGLLSNDSKHLTQWARELPALPPGQAFLNFTSSHDGIGVRPLQGILEPAELDWLVEQVRARNGQVSMRAMPDGSEQPYELNITYCDALAESENPDLGLARFFCSQAIALSFYGMPAIYFHSLVGTPNWEEGVEQTGHNRAINRRKFTESELGELLDDEASGSRMPRVFARYQQWLRRRRNHPAFHPEAGQEVLDLGSELFAFIRTSQTKQEQIICLFNFTDREQKVAFRDLGGSLDDAKSCRDILNGITHECGPRRSLKLKAYQAVWLVPR